MSVAFKQGNIIRGQMKAGEKSKGEWV